MTNDSQPNYRHELPQPTTDEAARKCTTCFGTGKVHIFNDDGSIRGVSGEKCTHMRTPLLDQETASNVINGQF